MCKQNKANPFWINGPIEQKQNFFGRSKETQRVLQFLRKEQSVSIVGPPRRGKTSFLNYIADPGVLERYQMRADEHIFVRIDSRLLADVDQGRCFYSIREEIIHQFESFDATIGAKLREATISTVDTTAHFGLRTLFRTTQENGLMPIVALDNFDDLAKNTRLEDSFFAALRSIVTNYRMAYLMISQRPLHELEKTRPEASTLSGICQYIPLRPFTLEESYKLVTVYLERAGIRFPAFAIELILGLGCNDPYLVQLAGYHAFEVWRENGGDLQETDYEVIEHRFREAMNQ